MSHLQATTPTASTHAEGATLRLNVGGIWRMGLPVPSEISVIRQRLELVGDGGLTTLALAADNLEEWDTSLLVVLLELVQLARARNAMAYGQASAEQAGWLMAEGIVKNHPFINGNKRTALLALVAFWEKNGVPVPHDAVWLARRILALAER